MLVGEKEIQRLFGLSFIIITKEYCGNKVLGSPQNSGVLENIFSVRVGVGLR